jgi:hypothetical protein
VTARRTCCEFKIETVSSFSLSFGELRKRSKINKDNLSIAAVEPKNTETLATEKHLIVIISSAAFNYDINHFFGNKPRRKNREMKIALNGNSKAIDWDRKTSRRQGYSDSRDKKPAANISHTIGWLNWKESTLPFSSF